MRWSEPDQGPRPTRRSFRRPAGKWRPGAVVAPLLALIILAVTAPSALQAQTVAVRAGEHATFSRLALDLPRRSGWRVERGPNAATLIIAQDGIAFDTTAVFNRIPRERLTGLSSPAPGRLVLDLACACPVEGFWHTDRMLVIDIRDPRRGGPEPGPGPAPRQIDQRSRPNSASPAAEPSARSLATRMITAPWHPPRTAATDTRNSPPNSLPVTQPTEDTAALDIARDRLLRQISRAGDQGLLTRRDTHRPQDHIGETAQETADGAPTEEQMQPGPSIPDDPGQPAARANLNLRAQSSIDRDFLRRLAAQDRTLEANKCLSPARVDIAAWAPAVPFPQALADGRSALLGEFDRPDQDAVLGLTRLYLHAGFGREAQEILSLADPGTPDRALLRALAYIVDLRQPVHSTSLPDQLDCDTPGALWAVLATPRVPRDVPVKTDAILRAFDGLPQHLRRHLGAELARRLNDAGHPEIADHILRIIERPGHDTPPQAELVRVQIDIAHGRTDKAQARLAGLARGNTPAAAHAVLRQIEMRIKAGQPITLETAQLAGARALEHRGSDLGHDLALAYLTALAASGAFDQALEELSRLGPELPPGVRAQARHAFMAHLTEQADSVRFLEHVLGARHDPSAELPPEIADATARRLLREGFPDQAMAMLDGPASASTQDARRRLRAEIALAQGRSRQAQVELLGLDGRRAAILRARAAAALGNHVKAAELYRTAGAEAEATQQAWLAEDWPALTAQDDPALAALARHLGDPPGAPSARGETPPEGGTASPQAEDTALSGDGAGVLARDRDLLREGAALRAMMRDLLATRGRQTPRAGPATN